MDQPVRLQNEPSTHLSHSSSAAVKAKEHTVLRRRK
jgi:hypothetical protein